MDKIKIYSPLQVATLVFLGGPLSAAYVLKKNFDALKKDKDATFTTLWVGGVALLCIVAAPFLPGHQDSAIPLTFTCGAYYVARKEQMSKLAITQSAEHIFQSNWGVFGRGIGFALITVVFIVIWVNVLAHFNLIAPHSAN